MSLIVQTILRLLSRGGRAGGQGGRRCAECGRAYRPGPGDRGRCAACEGVRRNSGEKADDDGKPFRED